MHHLVPRFVLEKYRDNERSGRFNAASLFIDIAGFTTLTDELMSKGSEGSEKLAEVMRGVFTPLINAIHHFDGFVATLAGDAITALFPEKDGDSFGRALECASHLPSVFEARINDIELSARFGLAFGDIQWRIIKSESQDRAAYYFAGRAIDDSVDVQNQAGKNGILVHESLQQLVSAPYRDFLSREGNEEAYRFSKRERTPVTIVDEPISEELHSLSQAFFPKELLEQEIPGEFRQVVNLFIQLPNDLADPEFKGFVQTLFALQRNYGGVLNRLDFGDKGAHLYLFWGAPVSFESDIERALGFVSDIQSQTGIPISAGISHRVVHAGFIGSNLREEYTCHGRCVNLAARLMVSAPAGEVWLDAKVAKRAQTSFDIELEGTFAFKGFSEEQQVFVLYERKEESQRFFENTLLGREDELKTIAAFINPIFDNRYAGNLLIVGDAGAGKSHLLHTLEESDELAERAQWLTCQTNQILVTSLNPFRYMLKGTVGISDKQGEEINKRNFNRRMNNLIANCDSTELAAELERTQSFLGALLGLRWLDSLYEQLEPQSRLENTFLALVAFFQALSLEQPLIIFVEDAHWLDSDSKNFLVRLDRMLKAAEDTFPIALLISARPVDDLLPADLSYETIELALLNQRNIQSLTTAFLGKTADEVIDLIFARSQGNPFFAEQIARYLQEQEQLEQIGGRWQFVTDAEQTTLPLDVRTVLMARIDLLSHGVKELVQTAAILGREFEVRLLSQVMQSDSNLNMKLSAAENAAVWTALKELRYLFKHALLRDAAYDMQLVSRRKALHTLAFESLETLYQADLSKYYAELAYHSEQAELTEKARLYLELAGDGAKEAFQNEQAVDFYSRALALTATEDIPKIFAIKLKREHIYDWQGKREQRFEELEALSALARQIDQDSTIRVLIRKAAYFYAYALWDETIQTVKEALPLMDEERDTGALYQAYTLLGRGCYFNIAGHSRDEAKEHWERAVVYAKRSKNSEYIAASLLDIGLYYRYLNDEKAKGYFAEALAKTENLFLKSVILNRLGSISRREKDFETGNEQYQESLTLIKKVGHRPAFASTVLLLGFLHAHNQDFDEAEKYFKQAERLGDELNDWKLNYDSACAIIEILSRRGKPREALSRLLEVRKKIDHSNKSAILYFFDYAARYCVRLGELQQAVEYTTRYLSELPSRLGYDELQARLSLANTYIELSEFTRAQEEILSAQNLLDGPEELETRFAIAITNLDVQAAVIKAALAAIALNQGDEQGAGRHMDDVLVTLANYELQTYPFDSVQHPNAQLLYQTYTLLKALNRSEAPNILNEAYRRVMEWSQEIGKTKAEQQQVWREDRFMCGIVEEWQVD